MDTLKEESNANNLLNDFSHIRFKCESGLSLLRFLLDFSGGILPSVPSGIEW